ncbi:peptide chain release factor N(5)-glutamine methyltransferase [Prevotella melaninogenica]|uniref:peptide chain release factor N(5)-glutamine methyltransferase n=1 Tax=Prevotella melaninogenica TaxID=28132 RepID=UPI001BAA4A76|nr:peptide chain release factor N(5)-glutamine methyltransferase [Prevotella melaninogenica]QUB55934.1 peptide chain release factor N(5)-glutamine methyltransferase [Prevotella melaninogenica]QUB58534.1 peptide chain release factor N(5)-glutamine methyltransferase [Prevotella melaninogenica]
MTYQDLWHRLTPLYDAGEAQAIVRLVLEVQFGITLTDIYTGKVNELSREAEEDLEKIILRLERSEPVQYVLGRETFCGRTFYVAPGVLIPRPETEVLCRWIEEDYNRPYCALQPPMPLQVLDVGTGSGCIAVTLAADLRNSAVTAWDISGDALLIARENVHQWQVRVELKMEDALHPSAAAMQQKFDVIVSNPPYICDRERTEMEGNVLAYEPETALFVPDDDPLRFYRAIAEYGVRALLADGVLYFETNPLYINDVKEMLNTLGYKQIELREDQFGKLRFTKAIRP